MPVSPTRLVALHTFSMGLAPPLFRCERSTAITSASVLPTKELTPGLVKDGRSVARVRLNAGKSKKNGSSRSPAQTRRPLPWMVRSMPPLAARPLGPVQFTRLPWSVKRQSMLRLATPLSISRRYSTASENRELKLAEGTTVCTVTSSLGLFGFMNR